jgi:hypothetical protein
MLGGIVNPVRVLAEVEAKRQIVEACVESLRLVDEYLETTAGPASSILGMLALPYVDHPDYRQEWKP